MKYKTEYESISIGKKIRELRKGNPDTKSQEAFIDVLKERYDFPISRNTLSRIENGDTTAFPLDFLLCVSDLFNCDIGYLLGEYNEATVAANKICEITGLSEKSIENLHKYKTAVDREYMYPTTDEDGEPCFYTSSIGSLYHDTLKIINELIINEDIYTLAKLLYELEFDSHEYFNQIEIRKYVHQKLYEGNGEYDNRSEAEKKSELVHLKKEKKRMNERIDLDRYRLTEFIIHLSDRYDQREQVKSSGNNNPTNK